MVAHLLWVKEDCEFGVWQATSAKGDESVVPSCNAGCEKRLCHNRAAWLV